MIKDLVANLSLSAKRDPAGDLAVSMAQEFGAHVAGVAFAYEPVITGGVLAAMSSEFIEAQRAESKRMAQAAIERFDEIARRNGLSAETRVLSATLGGATEEFASIARRFDLSVVAQAESGKAAPDEVLIEGVLFGSGRPTLVVPYIHQSGLKLDRVICCWDGSRIAARAIGDALPFLEKSKNVDLLVVETKKMKTEEVTGADMGEHLARHGLNVEVKRLASPNVDIADTILSYAADSTADLIVMGGYGHSRLRKFVLGGTTRGILAAMTVPTLMSH